MPHELNRQVLQENWQQTVRDVSTAIQQAGRADGSVRIIGVSKYVDSDVARLLVQAGCCDLGESRPQQLIEKKGCLASEHAAVTWHLIGHLQRNKVRRMVETADWIHSIDSLRLLESIASHSQQVGRTQSQALKLLIEVNVSGDLDKHGFQIDELIEAWPSLAAVQGVRLCGLMAMAGLHADRSQTRAQFSMVRQLRDDLERRYGEPLPELSMGMSGDFDIAIQEGATMVRVGSRLFDGVVV